MAKEEKENLTKEEKKALKEQKKEEKRKAKEEKKRAKLEAKAAKEGRTYDPDAVDEDAEGGTAAIAVVAIIIILVWLGIIGVLIKMDVGGVGSTVLYPILKDIPVVNRILPGIEEELEAKKDSDAKKKSDEEAAELGEDYQYESIADAVDEIKRLEQEIETLKSEKTDNTSKVSDLEAQVAALQVYKDNQDAFEQEKENFYQEVVYTENAPDIEEYKAYYEQIEPDNAEQIYKQVVQQLEADEQVKNYAKTYSSMDASSAAKIFDTMTDNLTLVAKILNAMSNEDRSAILSNMDENNAARLTELMEPQ